MQCVRSQRREASLHCVYVRVCVLCVGYAIVSLVALVGALLSLY